MFDVDEAVVVVQDSWAETHYNNDNSLVLCPRRRNYSFLCEVVQRARQALGRLKWCGCAI